MKNIKLITLNALLTLALTSPIAQANGHRSTFSQGNIEAYMQDYYRHMQVAPTSTVPSAEDPDQEPTSSGTRSTPSNGLSNADKDEYATDVLDQIILLPVLDYNDVLNHMAADYAQHPEHRDAIERVVHAVAAEHTMDAGADAARGAFRDQLSENQTPRMRFIQSILDDTVKGFMAVYAFQFGRGIWRGLQTEAQGMMRFRAVVQSTVESMNQGQRARWIGATFGSTAGLVQAVYENMRPHRNDPRETLLEAQRIIVKTNAAKAAQMRDELRVLTREPDPSLSAHADATRRRITEMDNAVTSMQAEMEHLYNVAPEYRSNMEPIAQDLTEVRGKVSRMGLRLDRLEVTAAAPL
jgi:hypothetical protein